MKDQISAAQLDDVMRDSRREFIERFEATLDGIASAVGEAAVTGAPAHDAVTALHRIVGLAGTVGLPLVSAGAARLEEALRSGPLDPTGLAAGIVALRAALAQDAPGVAPVAAFAPADSPRFTVLLIEDEPVQRTILSAQLRRAGHRVVAVASGEDAVAAARAARPDVILLDVELPGMSGHDVCRVLKSDRELAAIPVAFLSAHADLDSRLAGLSYGADDFLTKPIDPRELELRIQLLRKRTPAPTEAIGTGVLGYEPFCERARTELTRERAALALLRAPADRCADVAALARDEIRRRDLCGHFDRTHVVVLLPDTGAGPARDRIASIVENCRSNGMGQVFAGIAASPAAGARTLEQLIEEADEALAAARYENVPAALKQDGARPAALEQTVAPLVLVADDDPDVVRILDAHLAAGGYRRIVTFDGSRALEEIRAQHPDIIVLDLMMPRMTGFDVLARLRDLEGPRPHVVVLSARGREEDVIRAFGLGADDFMAKPFNPQELLARISRLVR